ncbi:MAG TPA: hypothetical protein VGH44_02755 [Candidatus Saccharimonadia bacterium]|jgi:hypothetical protein
MQRKFRVLVVVVATAAAIWGSVWWVRYAYVKPPRPVAMTLPAGGPVVIVNGLSITQNCRLPNDTIITDCPEEVAEGEVVPVGASPVPVPTQGVAEEPEATLTPEPETAVGGAEPCITPPGAIFSPSCAAPPGSAVFSGGGGGGGAPQPCVTPAGAIFSPGC